MSKKKNHPKTNPPPPSPTPAPSAPKKSSLRLGILLLAIALLAVGGFLFVRSKRGPVTSAFSASTNVILISIDTVRDDCLQLYDPNGAPTPNLNRIASNGYVFSDMISQVPFTLPSHCTIMTGTYPIKHLVQENTRSKLSDSAVTMAEVFQKGGYSTAGFIGSIVLGTSVGFNQGFQTYDDLFTLSNVKFADLGGIQKNADEVYNSFLHWFDKEKPQKFFAFVHFYDAHAPYEPPPQFTPQEVNIRSMYQGELRYVDSVIGKMYDTLAAKGVWNNTLLIITGDHGEMLGEHGETGHGYFVYEQALRVPLIIVVPGHKGKTVLDKTVQLVDIMPTVLDLQHIAVPSQVQGRSLLPIMEGKQESPRFAFSESLSGSQTFGTAPLRSLQDSTYKYIDTARPELYNIKSDTQEAHNLYDSKHDLADKMKAALQDVIRKNSADAKQTAEERKLSPEESEQLASLGYIGGGATPEVQLTKDPKDYIQYWTDLSKLGTLINEGNYPACFAMTQRMRAADAMPVTGEIFEARCYMGTHDVPKAIAILEDVLKKDPENSAALSAVSDAYAKTGQLEKAIAGYKELVEKQTSMIALQNYASHMMKLGRKEEVLSYLEQLKKAGKLSEKDDEVVGEIYLDMKEYDKARQFLTSAIQINPDGYKAYALLASLMDTQGETVKALQLMERTNGRFDQVDFLLQLGVLYHKTGNIQGETQTFRKIIELHPKDPRGYFYLAKLVLDGGRQFDKVLELAQAGLDLKPVPQYQIFGNYLMADAYTNLGMKDKAESYYAKAKEINATEEENRTPGNMEPQPR